MNSITTFGFRKARELIEHANTKVPKLFKAVENRGRELTTALRDATRDQAIANEWKFNMHKTPKKIEVSILNDHPRVMEMEYGAGATKAPEGSYRSTLTNFSLMSRIKQDVK